MTCWACELARGERDQHKTRWFYLTPDEGIVCEDLHPKGFDMRLLYVPPWHLPCGSELKVDREQAIRLLTDIVAIRLPDYHIVSFDLDDHSFRAHWHAQAGLSR